MIVSSDIYRILFDKVKEIGIADVGELQQLALRKVLT